MKFFIIILNICLFLLLYKNTSINRIKNLIGMYKKSINSVNVIIRGGLGNRLMSCAGIIVLSIFYELKPTSIISFILNSN